MGCILTARQTGEARVSADVRQLSRGEPRRRGDGTSLSATRSSGAGPDESLGELMALVQQTMPQDNPGGLSPEAYTDVLAYLLKMNEYPAGEADLTAESLEAIVIEPPR